MYNMDNEDQNTQVFINIMKYWISIIQILVNELKKEVSQIVYLPRRKSRLNLFIFRNQYTPHVNRIGFLYTMDHSSQCIHCCFTCIPVTFSILNRNISLFFIVFNY